MDVVCVCVCVCVSCTQLHFALARKGLVIKSHFIHARHNLPKTWWIGPSGANTTSGTINVFQRLPSPAPGKSAKRAHVNALAHSASM